MIGIYRFLNKINNKSYIGQSVNIEQRYKDHVSRAFNSKSDEYNSLIHKAIRKYGLNNFSFEILEECKKEELNEKEKFWIKQYNSFDNGYNLTTGGNQQEATKKFDDIFIKNIQQILLNSNITYQEIHNKYNISLGQISAINQGKVGFNEELNYPLRLKKKEKYCPNCGKIIGSTSTLCIECYKKEQKNNRKITRDELKKLIRTKTFVEIGKMYNVSDKAITKWCISENLPSRKKDIKILSDEEWNKI